MAVLYRQFYNKSDEKVSASDSDIQKYIRDTRSDNYEAIIKDDTRWDVFFHLSDLRAGLLNWYDFDQKASLLEIGAGFGALTGLFCKKCSQVTVVEESMFRAETLYERYDEAENLKIYAGDVENMSFSDKFDYIVLAGGLETRYQGKRDLNLYVAYLHKIISLLKPSGILLLAIDNRYGLKYFCGEPDSYTGIPFAGINGAEGVGQGRMFSKQEISDVLNQCGMGKAKFYYPLPDYKLPQLIYSDMHLPEKNLNERLIPYYRNGKMLLANEMALYNDIIDNHVFPFFANSYLIECSKDGGFSSVSYAALSTDRGRNKAFATTIRTDGSVCKQPLYLEGHYHAESLYENINALHNRGISVVAHQWDGKVLKMPFISSDTLSNYLKDAVRKDPKEFLSIIEQLYEIILQSSELATEKDNVLLQYCKQPVEWGPILKKAYLELIPLNCFYDHGRFLFFDQEYVKENYPAKYILFRALHYIYIFAPHAEQYVPLRVIKERYGLTDIWNVFLQEENERFLREVRRHEIYQQFYKWSVFDSGQMQRNALLLGFDSAVDAAYSVSKKMKQIRQVQLELLRELVRVCDKHRLQYFMIYGTLLGAVRHEGFIPWDDDIDIAMPRKDYEKLKQIASGDWKEAFFLQTMENDKDCFYGGYMRLRNSNTTGISWEDFGKNCNQGIWIDILPLDVCTMNQRNLQKKVRQIRFWQSLLYAKVYGETAKPFQNLSRLEKFVYKYLARSWRHEFLCERLEKVLLAYTEEKSDYCAIFTHYGFYKIFDQRDFLTTEILNFEDMRLAAPKGYRRCLEMSVGRDYMKYPPLAERRPHHLGIFHANIPFQSYNDFFMNLFTDIQGKTLVVFGAGLMFENYMKIYGKTYLPDFLVDNDAEKWGIKRQGIEVKNPSEIVKIPQEKLHLIICSVYYREIEKQLRKMGISRYKIYVQEKEWILRDEEQERSY